MARSIKTLNSLLAIGGTLFFSAAAAAFPEPYCVRSYESEVKPITHVRFAGMDNSSSAQPTFNNVDGDQDFTRIESEAQMAPGARYTIIVDANTDGEFTDAIVLYIDWNQNGVFDDDESYFVGTITDSNGLDGQNASTTITVPVDVTPMPAFLRMRVTHQLSAITGTPADAPACDPAGLPVGQAEDYEVDVANSAPIPPTLSETFTPANAPAPATSTLTLAIGNPGEFMQISENFSFTLPPNMLLVDENVSTNCEATVIAIYNEIDVTNGGIIPSGGCTISVNVKADYVGIYVNAIPAGALATNQGLANGASATFQATQAGVTAYNTGFESPFSVAAIDGQFGWSGSGAYVGHTVGNAAHGTQYLSLVSIENPSAADEVIASSPQALVGTTTYSSISANILLSHRGNGTDWRFNPRDFSGYAPVDTALIQFDRSDARKILVGDLSGTTIALTDTGATYPADTYFSIKAIVNRDTGELVLCKNGTQVFDDATGAHTRAHNITDVVLSQLIESGNTADNAFLVDDLVVDDTNSGACDGGLAWTVAPSVGMPSGTISPAVAQQVGDGTPATFTLTPAANFHLGAVGGTCEGVLNGNNYTTTPVVADCSVIANFAADPVVTPTVGVPSGTITPAAPQTVEVGSTPSFTLMPAAGFHSDTVTGTCGGTLSGNVYTTAAVTADCIVIANFAANPSHVVTPSVGMPSGTIAPATPQTVGDAATASFTLAPASGFHIASVGGSCGGTLSGNVYMTAAVTADCSVIANFAANPVVTPTVGTPSGTITPATPQTVEVGSTPSFTVMSTTGFHLDTVSGTCGGTLVGDVYTTAAVTADCSVIANFAANPVVTPTVGTPSGTITPATPQTVEVGSTPSFTLMPATGFHIDTVAGTCGGKVVGDVYTTAAVTADCSVIANFKLDANETIFCDGFDGAGCADRTMMAGSIKPAAADTRGGRR